MKFDFVWRIARKELLLQVRDHRAFISSIVIAFVLTPTMYMGFPLLISKMFSAADRQERVAVIGLAHMPLELKTSLESQKIELVNVPDAVSRVQHNEFSVGLEIPLIVPSVQNEARGEIKLIQKNSNIRAAALKDKVRSILDAYNNRLLTAKLSSAGLKPDEDKRLVLVNTNVETTGERAAGFMGFLIALLLFSAASGGSQAIAIDATAGEKERGTLETLLITPVSKLEVLSGKLIATIIWAFWRVCLMLLAFGFTALVSRIVIGANGILSQENGRTINLGGSLAISGTGLLQLALIAITMIGFLAASIISIASRAKNFRQAGVMLQPLDLMGMIVSMGAQFADFIQRTPLIYSIPILGSILGLLDVVKGIADWSTIFWIVSSNVLFGVLAMYYAWHTFRREDVLFKN